MWFQFAKIPEVRTKMGTNPQKFANIRLCLQTGETRLQSTSCAFSRAPFFELLTQPESVAGDRIE